MLNSENYKNNSDENTEIRSDVEKLEVYSDKYPTTLSLRIENFCDEKEYKIFIKNCEKLVRSSLEFREWRKYIKDVLSITSCSFTNEIIGETTLEIHHHIPSLFLMVKAVINKEISQKHEFSTFDISLEVLKLHFMNKLGFVCLLKNLHEKFHNGFLEIPMELVKGNYQAFVDEYSLFLDEEDLLNLKDRFSVRIINCKNYPYMWQKDQYGVCA